MKLGFRKPSPNAYMMLLNGLAFRERVIPIPGDFDPRDPVAVRAAYERDCTGPANGPRAATSRCCSISPTWKGEWVMPRVR